MASDGDLDNDGHPDLLFTTSSGDLYVARGTGTASSTEFTPNSKQDILIGSGGWQHIETIS